MKYLNNFIETSKLKKYSIKFKFKKKTPIFFIIITILLSYSLAQKLYEKNDDLTFTPKPHKQDEHIQHRSNPPYRRPNPSRSTRSTTTKVTQPTIKTTTPKLNQKQAQIPNILHSSSMQPPFIYSSETLNQTHANMFKNWIDIKSHELYELSMNYSGFKLLNATYNIQLRKDAKFAWINFTEMIINISNTISEVLNHKTLIVKNLTDLVEKSFDEYRNNTLRLNESAYFLYYDAKSPKTFCDVQEAAIQRAAKKNLNLTQSTTSKTPHININITSSTVTNNNTKLLNLNTTSSSSSNLKTKTTTSSSLVTKQFNSTTLEVRRVHKKRNHIKTVYYNRDEEDDDDIDFDDELNIISLDNNFLFDLNHYLNDSHTCPFPHNHHDSNYFKYHREKRLANQKENQQQLNQQQQQQRTKNPKQGSKKPKKPSNSSRTPSTSSGTNVVSGGQNSGQSSSTLIGASYDDIDEKTDLTNTYDYNSFDYEYSDYEKSPFWNISCINRTYDENFKNFQKGVNRNHSTLHVPTNVYKQDLDINMTAYWTEALDELFKFNYDNDNELFWQYFCSSNGLFRRFPGAYWTVPQNEDFFDCRLQSWYIMAAASPKDVLILLDTSGSMTGLRLEIGKKLVEAIMDTLSDNDFFNILTFSNTVDYLMNKDNETMYRDRFVQAGRTNKKKFIDRLKWFKNTSNIANFEIALEKSFNLLLKPDLNSDSCGCNKAIMILTDGASENAEQVFRKYNWHENRTVRVFTFLIGRDMIDPRQVEWMACANDGKFFHVATLADVNEHVHEYIPVLSRPMALLGHHETTWSNVFVGHLDKELKIAVARPAFKTKESLQEKIDLVKKDKNFFRNQKIAVTTKFMTTQETDDGYSYEQEYDENQNEYQDDYEAVRNYPDQDPNMIKPDEILTNDEKKNEYDEEELNRILMLTDDILRKQQVLLGVVGVDVPVLRLISKVSPKYQMGVGIYIIMLDNNGFIVFHPSIKKEIASNDFNFKGTSNSIDLDRFEIPIDNDEEFEQLEHEMIDQITSNKTLDNWKREGLRVIRRRTEYVYTPVSKTPFSVAIASPSSFGRYYIDLPSEKESDYEKELKELMKNKFETNIQLYNCTYNYTRLIDRLLNAKMNLNNSKYMDYCIRYLFQDKDQVLAIKSDLVFHNIYYNLFNFSMFTVHPNLIKSSFYGTYSGITFYLPVTFYRSKMGLTVAQLLNLLNNESKSKSTQTNKQTNALSNNQKTTDFDTATILQPGLTEPPSEMTINVELRSIIEPLFQTSTKPTMSWSNQTHNFTMNNNQSEIFHMSLNLFSTESNKHTYSFEKQYYTRSIEFSDYLRTEFNFTEPVVNYFLNESSKETRRDTVGATIPIWLDKVPTAVTGVVYDAQLLQFFLFENFMQPDCDHVSCRNLCSQRRGMNLTCYLVDEHGIVVLSTQERLGKMIKEPVMGQPLYKVNPWLMKILEYEGIYDLVIPGKELPECKQERRIFSNSSKIRNFFSLILKSIFNLLNQILLLSFTFLIPNTTNNNNNNYNYVVNAQSSPHLSLADRIRIFNNEWRGKNSHCYNFGVYSFNLTKWGLLDESELRVWCNSTNSIQRKFLVSHVKHSNLIMLVVEDEFELIHCGNISQLIKHYETPILLNMTNETVYDNSSILMTTNMNDLMMMNNELFNFNESNSTGSLSSVEKKKPDFSINRYRKKPDSCYNNFPKEKEYLPCMNESNLIVLIINKKIPFACYLMLFLINQIIF